MCYVQFKQNTRLMSELRVSMVQQDQTLMLQCKKPTNFTGKGGSSTIYCSFFSGKEYVNSNLIQIRQ